VGGFPSAARGETVPIVLDWIVADRFKAVVKRDLAVQKNGNSNGGPAFWYGLGQYLNYTLSDRWKFGSRVEWFRDEEGVRVSGLQQIVNLNVGSFPGNFFEITIGTSWTTTPNVRIRPELPWDWADTTGYRLKGVACHLQLVKHGVRAAGGEPDVVDFLDHRPQTAHQAVQHGEHTDRLPA
jgi:hypothetical protein